MDVDAGEVTIPQIMGNHHALHGMQTQTSYMPYWAWSSGQLYGHISADKVQILI